MRTYSLTHLSDAVLLRDLAALISNDRLTTADLLAHIAEVDARKLYVPAGHSSMHGYCVEELRLSEGAAYKRIRAARAARDFPELLPAIAEGRLHLAAICLLAPYLTRENVAELTRAATHRRKSEVEVLLARRFPLAEVPSERKAPEAVIRPIPASRPRPQEEIPTGPLFPPALPDGRSPGAPTAGRELSPGTVGSRTKSEVTPAVREPKTAPPEEGAKAGSGPAAHHGSTEDRTAATERYLLKLILDKETHDRLRYAQTLLSHVVPIGDVAQVLRRALEALIPQLEKRKFGATTRKRMPRPPVRLSTANRHIPAYIRNAVWERDDARCTFVGTNGRQCKAKRRLEFDHVDPHVRQPEVTVEGLRLRCRVHNQYEAERIFGAEFMARKREEAKRAAGPRREGATSTSEGDRVRGARTRHRTRRR